MNPDTPLYIALVLLLGYLALVGMFFYWKSKRHRKKPSRKRAVIKKRSPHRQFSDERLQLNLMAMEAARQMAAVAAKSQK